MQHSYPAFVACAICSHLHLTAQVGGKACMASDCWAIGVIAYMLLSGHFPFYAATDEGIMLKVRFSKPR
jgi:serine/threonine protein kinase